MYCARVVIYKIMLNFQTNLKTIPKSFKRMHGSGDTPLQSAPGILLFLMVDIDLYHDFRNITKMH